MGKVNETSQKVFVENKKCQVLKYLTFNGILSFKKFLRVDFAELYATKEHKKHQLIKAARIMLCNV